jgi:soluble lytic murein transglycosylase-like protein
MRGKAIQGLCLLLYAFFSSPVAAGEFDVLYQVEAAKHGIDWRLVKAVASAESSENPNAENRRDPSVGLMQLLCKANAEGRCTNHLNIDGWTGITREQLFDPATNIRFGAAILAWNIRAYGLRKGVACYNSWPVCRDRQKEPFSNQHYVNRVMRAYRALNAGMPPAGGVVNNTRSASRLPTGQSSSPVMAPDRSHETAPSNSE